ncbi:unnamed protein product [Rhizophagus irregularis]|nr:unnamed protein product [Rhizophagus irregularis]CAB5386274.1 unnamed protein product [Rhizophagus irregularis]
MEQHDVLFQNGDPSKRSAIQKFISTLKSKKLKESMPRNELLKPLIQQFKLNYGLFLDGFRIEPSRQAILIEDGELNISLYDDQPFVYTSINDSNSRVNLLSFNSYDNDVELDKSLRPLDVCINFPVAEITFTADLSESFSNFTNDDEGKLHEMYGHLLPRKILIGGKLFIHGLESVNSNQIDIFNSYLTWVYNSAKYEKEIPFNNLSALNFSPKITTIDGKDLDSNEKLTDWMNNLYQNDAVKIISYNNIVSISQLKLDKLDKTSFVNEIQPGVANFKEKLTLENWVKYSKYVRWVKEFQLFQGLIIDQNFELKICKEKAFDLINIPNVESSDKFYLEMVKQTTILEEILINNNIFSANNNSDISSFPFIKVSDDPSYQDNVYFLVKCERYKISLSKDNIKPSEKLKKDIDKALESMTPLICLQKIFDKYGWFISLNISLGKSLKNIIGNLSNISKKIDFALPVFESLAPHLTDYGINCLITQKGEIIKENDLPKWIQNAEDDLEVIELNNIIPLYNILEVEQMKRIDTVLNKQDKFKIIMTGSIDLKDSDITKQIIINIEPSLDNKNYEVFGSIVSKNNSKLNDIFVIFGSYEINRFSAKIIITSKSTNISVEECYIIWMIIGNPSELSVFCPKNREIQADYFKRVITIQHNNSSYSIKTSHQLSQGYDISIKCFEPVNIELTGWSKNCVYLNILNSSIDFNSDQSNVGVAICTLSHSDHEKININGKKYSMGYILTENNYRGEPQLEKTNTRKYIDKRYPIIGDRKKLNELIITNENLEGHLDLTDFINLEKLQCSKNKLTSLDISKNEKLIEIDCSQNNLISLDLSNCLNIKSVTSNYNHLSDLKLFVANNETLEYLNLLDNLFFQKLNCFGRLVNLKDLHVGNTDEGRIEQGIYNRFYGSLKPLKNLIKLENLSINDTDIDSGLEYLPDSIAIFRCSADKRPEAKVIRMYEQLNIYTMSFNDAFQGRYNLKAWKKNQKLIKENETLQNQIKQMETLTLDAKLTEFENEKNILRAKEEELIKKTKQLECEINGLKREIKDLNADLKQQKDVCKQNEQQIEEGEKKLESLIEKIVEKEELQKEIKALKDDLAIKEKDIKRSEIQLEEKKKELEFKEEEYANIKNELDEIRSSLSDIENKKGELDSLKKKLEHEKHFSKTGTSELRKKIGDLKKYLKSSQSKKSELEAKAKEIEKKFEEIRKHKEELQNEQNNQKDCKEKFQKDKENLEHKLKKKENLINDLRQQNEEKIAALNDEIKKNDELIDKLKRQNEENITALNNQLENKGNVVNKLQQQIDELKRQMNEETEKYQNSQKNLKKDIGALLSQIQTQQTELSELVNNAVRNHDLGRKGMFLVDNILVQQRNIILTNSNSVSEELVKIKGKLIDLYDFTEETIHSILYKQAEKTKLEMKLESLIN